VLRALAKNPDDRYPSAAAMRADVDRARTGRTVAAPEVATTTRIPAVPPAATTGTVPVVAAPAESSRRNRALIGVLIALVVALALLAIVFARDLFGSGTQVRVPAVIGLTVEQAADELESSGLDLGRQDEEASDRPVGEVLDQDPDEGDLVDEGGNVNVTVSSGPGQVQVPTLVGLTQEQAVEQLNQAGLELGTITPQESSEPDREVLASEPAEGSNVDRGTRVNLTVSSGRIAVPDVTNQPVGAASSSLEQLGFEVQVTQEPNAAAEGTVIRQSPAAGTVLPQGRTVTLVVASPLPPPTSTPTPTQTPTSETPPPPAPAAAAPSVSQTTSPSETPTP
jgi:eukaryotic-like serine/threonine-protein kinase